MLTPRELYLAQGFPEDYIINFQKPNGKWLSKAEQVKKVGNSVCPPLAEALVRVNLPELAYKGKLRTMADLIAEIAV